MFVSWFDDRVIRHRGVLHRLAGTLVTSTYIVVQSLVYPGDQVTRHRQTRTFVIFCFFCSFFVLVVLVVTEFEL